MEGQKSRAKGDDNYAVRRRGTSTGAWDKRILKELDEEPILTSITG
jgi:hypothetical protein